MGALDGLFGHAIKTDGTLLQQRSFLNFIGVGLTISDNPTTNSTDITLSGVIPSLSESGHGVVSTSGFINLGASSAGIYAGYSTASEAQLLGWDGTTRTLAHGSAEVLIYQLLSTTSAKWRVNGVDRVVADGTNSKITSPNGASMITCANTTIECTASARFAVIFGSTDRVVVSTTKTSIVAPNGTSAIEVSNTGVLFSASPPTVTGSRGGNAALADLLTKLAALGLIVDGTS